MITNIQQLITAMTRDLTSYATAAREVGAPQLETEALIVQAAKFQNSIACAKENPFKPFEPMPFQEAVANFNTANKQHNQQHDSTLDWLEKIEPEKKKTRQPLPPEFVKYIQKCEGNRGNLIATVRFVIRRLGWWRLTNQQDYAIPGYDTPPPLSSYCSVLRCKVPSGWSYSNLSHLPKAELRTLLPTKAQILQIKVQPSGVFKIQIPEVSPDALVFEARAKSMWREIALNVGETYIITFNPTFPKTVSVANQNGAYLGVCSQIEFLQTATAS